MHCPKGTQKYFEVELISELRKRYGHGRVMNSSGGGEYQANPDETVLYCLLVKASVCPRRNFAFKLNQKFKLWFPSIANLNLTGYQIPKISFPLKTRNLTSLMGYTYRYRAAAAVNDAPDINTCDTCGYSSANYTTFRKHFNRHSICTECGACFHNRSLIKKHNILYHEGGVTARLYDCRLCEQQFPSAALLETHRNAVHLNKVGCFHCPKLFKSEIEAKAHADIAHRSHSCPDRSCSKSYINRDHLLRHIRGVHKELALQLENWRCEICSRKIDGDSLENHMKSI